MGDHYVPQVYLNRFCDPGSGRIWTYDMAKKDSFRTIPKNVAQEKDFYSTSAETYFCRNHEATIRDLFERIDGEQPLDHSSRKQLAAYIYAQLKRVPAAKLRYRAEFTRMSQDVMRARVSEIETAVQRESGSREDAAKLLAEIEAIVEEFRKDPPDDIWHAAIIDERHQRTIAAICAMRWRILSVPTGHQFVTGDNPVFIFGGKGVGHIHSELTFPLSTRKALLATWIQSPALYCGTHSQAVKEINRRTIANSTRFVFSEFREPWIPKVASKRWISLSQRVKLIPR